MAFVLHDRHARDHVHAFIEACEAYSQQLDMQAKHIEAPSSKAQVTAMLMAVKPPSLLAHEDTDSVCKLHKLVSVREQCATKF